MLRPPHHGQCDQLLQNPDKPARSPRGYLDYQTHTRSNSSRFASAPASESCTSRYPAGQLGAQRPTQPLTGQLENAVAVGPKARAVRASSGMSMIGAVSHDPSGTPYRQGIRPAGSRRNAFSFRELAGINGAPAVLAENPAEKQLLAWPVAVEPVHAGRGSARLRDVPGADAYGPAVPGGEVPGVAASEVAGAEGLDGFLLAPAMEHDSPLLLFRLGRVHLRSARVIRPGVVTPLEKVGTARLADERETHAVHSSAGAACKPHCVRSS